MTILVGYKILKISTVTEISHNEHKFKLRECKKQISRIMKMRQQRITSNQREESQNQNNYTIWIFKNQNHVALKFLSRNFHQSFNTIIYSCIH